MKKGEKQIKEYPFIWGVQYYRAPTPAKEHWEKDLKQIKEIGFTDIRFWIMWRWNHRNEDEYDFSDIDCLMELAKKNNLRVTLGLIFDVTPSWILKKYPDVQQVLSNGNQVKPFASLCRQIGGTPGPCFNHEGALNERKKFLEKVVTRYRNHPSLFMWDVWCEPEQCFPYRHPDNSTMFCYCPNCYKKFQIQMKKKYGSIDKLNEVWGKCFRDWDDLELPLSTDTFADFIDFREFHLDTMTEEANWRLNLVKKLDALHPVYLHVVPNTSKIFNAVTGVDDYAITENCDVFAATNFAEPVWSIMTMSAARGKTAYNVECHIGAGSTKMHQKIITLDDMIYDLVPQIGLGLRGFMFWQYHAETLGLEAPAWGCAKPDGSLSSVGIAAQKFISILSPYINTIMQGNNLKAQIAVWKGRKNELFSYCIDSLEDFGDNIEAYLKYFYLNNYNCKVVDDKILEGDGLDDVKLLILPHCYEADKKLVEAVNSFVEKGGVILCEAHFGGYNADTGRHSEIMPGLSLDKEWGIREEITTSSYYLRSERITSENMMDNISDDLKKALDAYGVKGNKYFEIKMKDGSIVAGAERFATLQFREGEALGTFDNHVCIACIPKGKGHIFYCGTNLGNGAAILPDGFKDLMEYVCTIAQVEKNMSGMPFGVHTDIISDNLIVVNNTTDSIVEFRLEDDRKGIFYDKEIVGNKKLIPAHSAEILVKI